MAKARSTGTKVPEAPKSAVREILEAVVIALVLALAIRTYAVQAFKIPSGSMIPTLLVGDHILVNKFLYGSRLPFVHDRFLTIREPRRGDILVFKFPKNHDTDYIKRLVGVPGDTVEMLDQRIYVNGELWSEDPGRYSRREGAGWALPGEDVRFGPIYVPRKGDTLQLVKGELLINGEPFEIPERKIFDAGNVLDYYDVFYAPLLPPVEGPTAHGTSDPRQVDEDRYFMLGDNRDNSRDGRFWGLVRDSEIRGKAFVIYWSWDRNRQRVRWRRIGDIVR